MRRLAIVEDNADNRLPLLDISLPGLDGRDLLDEVERLLP